MTASYKTCSLCGKHIGAHENYVYSSFSKNYYHAPPNDSACTKRRLKQKTEVQESWTERE